MTLILTEGFELRRSAAEMADVWTSVGVGDIQSSSTIGVATGNYAYRFSNGSIAIYKDLGADAHATMIAGHARRQRNHTSDFITFKGDAGATEHIVVRGTGADGNIAIDRGSTNIAITTTAPLAAFATNDFYYLEAKVVLADAGGSVEVRLNGVAILTFSGDTKNAGAGSTIDRVIFSGANDNSATFDDLYICNGAGASNNDFLGQVRCWPVSPSGNGNSSVLVGSDGNSTDNYLLVDEAIYSASATDYVGSAVAGDLDTYAFTDLTPTTGTIVQVSVGIAAIKSDAGTKQFRPVVRSAATNYAGADTALSTSIGMWRFHYTTDPATAAAWTLANVNAAEFGFEVRT